MAIPQRHGNTQAIADPVRTFFVTSATLDHCCLLQSERMAGLMIEVLYHYRTERKYRLHAFVVMPDHFHLLLSLGPELTVERAVQFIKGGSSFRAGRQYGIRNLWQRGFSEARISTARDYSARKEYIDSNPGRAGLATVVGEFVYCSAYPGYELDPSPFAAAVLRG